MTELRTKPPDAYAANFAAARPPNRGTSRGTAALIPKTGHGSSAANPACEVSNIAIVDGENLKPEENDHETLRGN